MTAAATRDETVQRARASLAAGRSVLLTGPPGIGRSTVLDTLAAERRAAGVTVLAWRGVPAEADLPYLGVIDLLAPGSGVELPALPPATPDEDLRVRQAVLAGLCRYAARRPVLLVLDDAQWLDPASRAVLAFVARRLDRAAVAFLAAESTMDDRISRDLGPQSTDHLVLPPMCRLELGELLRDRQPPAATPVRDDFDLSELHPRWVSLRERPAERCNTKDRPGWLTLHARGTSLDEPDVTFVGRRQQHLSCRVQALVDATDGRGGLAVRLDERHHYEIEVADGQVQVLARIGPLRTRVAAQPVPAGVVVLRIEVAGSSAADSATSGPDTVSFGIEGRSEFGHPGWAVRVDRGRGGLHRPGHRHVRHCRHGACRLVRLSAGRRLIRRAAGRRLTGSRRRWIGP